MNLRVTPSQISNNTTRNVQARNVVLARLQQQISTGLRIARPSDDPFGHSEITSFQQQLNLLKAEESNINRAETQLNLTFSRLQEATSIFVQAKQVSLQAAQSVDQAERNALAIEVDHLLDRLLQTANAKDGGEYLFAGASTHQLPFELADAGYEGGLQRPVYSGSDFETATVVSASITVATRQSGADVFLRDFKNHGRGETLFINNSTGIQPGAGTDNAIGRGAIAVSHTGTTYAGGSGIAPGVGSVGNDNRLGDLSLEIIDLAGDGSSGTVSLNGGPATAFTNADNALTVSGPDGESLIVDTTNITAGFSGTITATGQGQLSVDGGKSFTAIDFSANQVVTNSATGEVTNVDTSQVRRAGRVEVEYTKTADAFTALIELRDDLQNRRGLANHELSESFNRRVGEIDAISDQLFHSVGEQAANLQDISILRTRNEDVQLEFDLIISNRQAVDYAKVATELQESLNLLEFTYASSSSILNQSILNYF